MSNVRLYGVQLRIVNCKIQSIFTYLINYVEQLRFSVGYSLAVLVLLSVLYRLFRLFYLLSVLKLLIINTVIFDKLLIQIGSSSSK